jgi:glycosyltransferase involved in cell wall biosynthesis
MSPPAPETPPRRGLRVLCLSPYGADGPSARHRILAHRAAWAEHGIRLTLWPFMTRRFYAVRRRFGRWWTAEKLAWMAFCTLRLLFRLVAARRHDIVIVHREAFPLGPPLVEEWLARRGMPLVLDIDDALWEPPSNGINQRGRFWCADRIARICAASRHVVAGNPLVAEYCARHAPAATVIPTPYAAPAPLPPAAGPPVPRLPVVVWIGNSGNAWYVAALLPVLERVAARAPFVLRLIGGADIAEVASPHLTIDRRPWSPAEEARLPEAAIGIMPLPDSAYERGKSGFKIVQYWSAGLAAIAAPVGVNATMIQPGEDGLLPDSDAAWEQALIDLLTDPARRARLAAAGHARFQAEYTREVAARAWLPILAGARAA